MQQRSSCRFKLVDHHSVRGGHGVCRLRRLRKPEEFLAMNRVLIALAEFRRIVGKEGAISGISIARVRIHHVPFPPQQSPFGLALVYRKLHVDPPRNMIRGLNRQNGRASGTGNEGCVRPLISYAFCLSRPITLISSLREPEGETRPAQACAVIVKPTVAVMLSHIPDHDPRDSVCDHGIEHGSDAVERHEPKFAESNQRLLPPCFCACVGASTRSCDTQGRNSDWKRHRCSCLQGLRRSRYCHACPRERDGSCRGS